MFVAQTLIVGFTGQLKGRWDNYLMQEDMNAILKAKKINEENEIAKDEETEYTEDAVATLIFSTTLIFSNSKHFIRDPSKIKDKTTNLLANLNCPKLQDFRWYKNMFLTKVMLISLAFSPFGKENSFQDYLSFSHKILGLR